MKADRIISFDNPSIKAYGTDTYMVVSDTTYMMYGGETYEVEGGFITNGADIPRALWCVLPPFSPEYIPAVIIHDWLCERARVIGGDFYTMKRADEAFNDVLKLLGVGRIKRTIMYSAVRLYHTTIGKVD